MVYCIRCSNWSCGGEGIISVSMSTNSSVKPIDSDICNNTIKNKEYIPGPGSVSITLTAYAGKGDNKWAGSSCKGSAQGSQTNILKYDGISDRWWFIPSRVHRAQIVGDVGNYCDLGKELFLGTVSDSQVVNGISISTEMVVRIGSELKYTGSPLALELPDLNSYTIDLNNDKIEGYLSSFTFNVDYPSPAIVSYTFDCMLSQGSYTNHEFFKLGDCN